MRSGHADRLLARAWTGVTLAAAAGALVAAFALWGDVTGDGGEPRLALAGAVAIDGFSVFFTVTICAAVALAVLLSDDYLQREGLQGPEFHVLVLLSAAGGILMAKANDLILVFLGLEILSIALYVLAAYHRRRQQSQEAAVKYFVLGAFSSAFLLYGIALVYGSTGSTNLIEIAAFLQAQTVSGGVLLGGIALLCVGLGFKVAAVPFHMWTPDVYEGSPTPVTGFMAAAAKAAGFAALLRVLFSTFETHTLDWQPIIWALAALSLVVGSVLAVVQDDVKRMLAYSSISHAGYVLVGLQAANDRGIAGALFYLLAYTFLILGSFGVATVVGRRGDNRHSLASYRGLATERPVLALAFAVLLLAQAGVPLTTGFVAKFYVISAAVESHSYALAIVAMLAAVVATFFYLRLIVVMYMGGGQSLAEAGVRGAAGDSEGPAAAPATATDDGATTATAASTVATEAPETVSGDGGPPIVVPIGAVLALGICLAVTVVGGIFPDPLVDFARHATLLGL